MMLDKVRRYLALADEVFKIYESDADWETKYDLIFSEELSLSLEKLFYLDWWNDTSYEEDVQAYVGALRDKCDELRKVVK